MNVNNLCMNNKNKEEDYSIMILIWILFGTNTMINLLIRLLMIKYKNKICLHKIRFKFKILQICKFKTIKII